MSYLVDSNVLLRLAQPNNPTQRTADNAVRTLWRRGESLRIASQNLIEFWAVATRPAASNGLSLSIEETATEVNNLKAAFTVLPDEPSIFSVWESIVLKYRVSGKQAHDAHLVAAMKAHNITHLLTFNDSDFKRYTEITVVNPNSLLNEEPQS
ncbi:MAG: type II toxin-antitoxin system VapC family toxin [Pyrinomonadaceae bacterium]